MQFVFRFCRLVFVGCMFDDGPLIENWLFSLFRFLKCLDNSVSCLYFSLRRDFK